MQNITKKIVSMVAAVSMVLVSAPLFGQAEAGAYFSPSMTASKQVANRGEVITYSLKIKATADSKTVWTGVSFAGPVEYVPGSAKATKAGTTVSLGDSFVTDKTFRNLGSMTKGQEIVVNYQGKIKAEATHNALTEVKTTTQARDAEGKVKQTTDCTAKVHVQVAAPAYKPSKSVDKTTARPGDTLTYTLTLKNTGNVTLNDVLFYDRIPTGTTYVVNSAVISWDSVSKQANENWVNTGINFGQLKVGETARLVFKVKVNSNVANGTRIQNVGQFKTNELPEWVQCAAFTNIVVEVKPTPTPTPTPTPVVPTPTPTPTKPQPTQTPETLPDTGSGAAVVISLTGMVGALIGRKYFA